MTFEINRCLGSTPCVKDASFLNLLPRSFAGEIREREQAAEIFSAACYEATASLSGRVYRIFLAEGLTFHSPLGEVGEELDELHLENMAGSSQVSK